MNQTPRITTKPGICFGKPCIDGTRIAVQDILGWLASGMSNAEIVEDFPELTEAHIRAALAFAANLEQRTRHWYDIQQLAASAENGALELF